jgi:lysophospholipid acyltransferase (LPLAT)-like uncharacterized protein
MKISPRLIAWPIALVLLLLKYTCRSRAHNDPRPELWAKGESYAYAVLHAHQVAAGINGRPGTGAMLSRSGDGELMALGLRVLGMHVVRGSSQAKGEDKGGREALLELEKHATHGKAIILAVDGPRGPRNHVRKGIAVLSQLAQVPVVVVVAVPSRRWIVKKAWDRMQIPKPFCRIDGYFGPLLRPDPNESVEQYRLRIETELNKLEAEHDPAEHKFAGNVPRAKHKTPLPEAPSSRSPA